MHKPFYYAIPQFLYKKPIDLNFEWKFQFVTQSKPIWKKKTRGRRTYLTQEQRETAEAIAKVAIDNAPKNTMITWQRHVVEAAAKFTIDSGPQQWVSINRFDPSLPIHLLKNLKLFSPFYNRHPFQQHFRYHTIFVNFKFSWDWCSLATLTCYR